MHRNPLSLVVLGVMLLACGSTFYLVEQRQKVLLQLQLVEAIQREHGEIEYYDDRCPIPYWLVRLCFDKTIYSVRKITFDFEEHPDLTRIPFQNFRVFDQLESLNVNTCGIADEDLRYVVDLPKLKQLDIYGSPTGDAGFRYLSRCRSLEELHVNHVNDQRIRSIASIKTLRTVSMSRWFKDEQLTDRGLRFLAPLKKLEDLSLYGQPITDAGLEVIGHFTRLQSLDVCRSQIDGPGLSHLVNCTDLRNLRMLDVHEIEDEDLATLAKLTSLETLALSDCPITDAGLMHLRSLTNLNHLWICQTKATPEGVIALKRALPKLSFVALRF